MTIRLKKLEFGPVTVAAVSLNIFKIDVNLGGFYLFATPLLSDLLNVSSFLRKLLFTLLDTGGVAVLFNKDSDLLFLGRFSVGLPGFDFSP